MITAEEARRRFATDETREEFLARMQSVILRRTTVWECYKDVIVLDSTLRKYPGVEDVFTQAGYTASPGSLPGFTKISWGEAE